MSQPDTGPAYRVTALQPMRRRAGMAFTPEPVTIAGGEFNAEQLLQLLRDPQLLVELQRGDAWVRPSAEEVRELGEALGIIEYQDGVGLPAQPEGAAASIGAAGDEGGSTGASLAPPPAADTGPTATAAAAEAEVSRAGTGGEPTTSEGSIDGSDQPEATLRPPVAAPARGEARRKHSRKEA